MLLVNCASFFPFKKSLILLFDSVHDPLTPNTPKVSLNGSQLFNLSSITLLCKMRTLILKFTAA